MICIFSYPSELSIASRRITLNHTGGLLRREVMETITLFNSGNSPLPEIALEMEEFRSGLSIFDKEGNVIPFLTKEDIRNRLTEDIKARLDRDDIFLAWMALSTPIQPQQYNVIKLRYLEYEDPGKNVSDRTVSFLPFYRAPFFNIDISFFANETLSISFNFEEGVTHEYGPVLFARDKNGNDIEDVNIGDNFHYTVDQHNFSLSISGRRRNQTEIQSIMLLYTVFPDKELRSIVGGITWFSIFFPILIVITYFHFNNLSLFGIMSTTELLSIFSLGIARFPSGLISIKRRLIISMTELFLVYVLILMPISWFFLIYKFIHTLI